MMSAVPVIRISRPHGNTAVLLWTGGENIRFFAAAGWLMFRKTSAVRAEQQEAMQTVSGQFSSGHRNDRKDVYKRQGEGKSDKGRIPRRRQYSHCCRKISDRL